MNTSKKEHENLMQIGEIAQLTGLNIQSLRYYERRKILKPTKKKSSGYRLYDKQSVRTLKFIKNAQELGFSLSEIEELLKLRVTSPSRASKVRERAAEKLEDVRLKIVTLQGIEQSLQKLIDDCRKNKKTGLCPIIENLELDITNKEK